MTTAGTITGKTALHASRGATVTVIGLSRGERGEAAKLWCQDGMTLDRVKAERRREAEAPATALGVAGIRFQDLGDKGVEYGDACEAVFPHVVSELLP